MKLRYKDFESEYLTKVEGEGFRRAMRTALKSRANRLPRIKRGYMHEMGLWEDPELEEWGDAASGIGNVSRHGGKTHYPPGKVWRLIRWAMLTDFREMGAAAWVEKIKRIVAESAERGMVDGGRIGGKRSRRKKVERIGLSPGEAEVWRKMHR